MRRPGRRRRTTGIYRMIKMQRLKVGLGAPQGVATRRGKFNIFNHAKGLNWLSRTHQPRRH